MTDIYNKQYEEVSPMVINIQKYMNANGLAMASITDAIVMFKNSISDADADSLYSKTLLAAELTKDDASFTISAPFVVADFTPLSKGSKYYICHGIKISGDVVYREIPTKQDKIMITEDRIRG